MQWDSNHCRHFVRFKSENSTNRSYFWKMYTGETEGVFCLFSVCTSVPFDVVKELILHTATDHLGVI